MLCYSWDALQEKDIVSVDVMDFKELYELFAKVLASGLEYLLKRGFDRQYVEVQEEMALVRGKINVSDSIKKLSLLKGRLICQYDDLSYNILQNQIIKATIERLLSSNIGLDIKRDLKEISRYFREIDKIQLSKKQFGMVHIHRNNHYYRFLLNICELVYDNLLVDEKVGKISFRDFLKEEDSMAALFENFVRNFYKNELRDRKVFREQIKWDAEETDGFLPVMETDISITSRITGRKIIIDTKYYKEAFSYKMNVKKLKSENLYQIFAYLKNNKYDGCEKCEGILLYPTVVEDFEHSYVIQGHKVSVRSINLNQDWQKIHNDLLAIVGE